MTDSNQLPLYEAMFLLDQRSGLEVQGGMDKVREILERSGAEIVALNKWDERKLAYAIRGQKRGTYLLGLFRVHGGKITTIERDCHLSEEVLRVMVTRGEHLGELEIEAAINNVQLAQDEDDLREGAEGEDATSTQQVGADNEN
ncbi:30S ribosomal protein S6 [Phycisphaerales bacterium AB-hyl4]|uniref:Small ribosomal subunit protein bS6 n=1 Tax=Natronomicrosphaera hydrolytica TaxID=3242702 RepID=A0ABV4U1S1_9BACT